MKKILKIRKKLRPCYMLPGNQKRLQSYTAESKRGYPPGSGNRLADKTARQAAEGLGVTSPIKALVLAELPELTLDSPKYTEAQNQLAEIEGAIKTERGGGNCQVANY